ncbi:MAG: hypothetical protein QGH45_06370, partial [Myxococcota bacterium]|nr:hypothetical protein [Myxococcota bacterium]
GAWDDCDETDDDCNGIVNDGTVGWDSYEPDDETPTDLGEISEDSMMLFTWAQSPGDIDRFQFFVDDNNDIVGDGFFIYAQVDTIPAGVDLSLTLNRLTDSDDEPWFMELDVSNEESYGGVEFVEHQGTWGANDDGIYELVVTAAQGYDCDDAYELYIETGS